MPVGNRTDRRQRFVFCRTANQKWTTKSHFILTQKYKILGLENILNSIPILGLPVNPVKLFPKL